MQSSFCIETKNSSINLPPPTLFLAALKKSYHRTRTYLDVTAETGVTHLKKMHMLLKASAASLENNEATLFSRGIIREIPIQELCESYKRVNIAIPQTILEEMSPSSLQSLRGRVNIIPLESLGFIQDIAAFIEDLARKAAGKSLNEFTEEVIGIIEKGMLEAFSSFSLKDKQSLIASCFYTDLISEAFFGGLIAMFKDLYPEEELPYAVLEKADEALEMMKKEHFKFMRQSKADEGSGIVALISASNDLKDPFQDPVEINSRIINKILKKTKLADQGQWTWKQIPEVFSKDVKPVVYTITSLKWQHQK